MCLILVAYKVIPGVELVLVSNRDEEHGRPTAFAHEWLDSGRIIAGKDLKAGGTWLGATRDGKVAAVTNIREKREANVKAVSRGELPVLCLSAQASVKRFAEDLVDGDRYNGFNMLFFDGQDLGLISNRASGVFFPRPGYYGISNGPMDADWPKVASGKEVLRMLGQEIARDADSILKFMRSTKTAPDETLPDTGVGIELERTLSSPFIVTENYGTRCTTIVRVFADGNLEFDEYSYADSTEVVNHESFRVESISRRGHTY